MKNLTFKLRGFEINYVINGMLKYHYIIQYFMKEQFEILATWWANAIVNPNCDNGTPISFILEGIQVQNQNTITTEQLDKFKTVFVEFGLRWIEEFSEIPIMSVDYKPSEFLEIVIDKVGISNLCLPIKSYTTILDNKVYAKKGYGNLPNEII